MNAGPRVPAMTFMRVSFGLDLLKFALVLPVTVWLLARARVRGPRAAQA